MTVREEIAIELYRIGVEDRDSFICEYNLDIRKSRTWDELPKSTKEFWEVRADQILSIKRNGKTLKELIEEA